MISNKLLSMPDRKLDDLVKRLQEAKKNKEVTSIGYHGNIVTVWERLVEHMQETGERLVDLGSDQVGEAKGHFKMMLAQVLNVYPI